MRRIFRLGVPIAVAILLFECGPWAIMFMIENCTTWPYDQQGAARLADNLARTLAITCGVTLYWALGKKADP